jgi:hypothetical protein
MITTNTIFVLGAGASIPYGFPSGETLVNHILGHSSDDELGSAGIDRTEFKKFQIQLLSSKQSSVDAFLEHRTDLQSVGKKAIALHLIHHETEDKLFAVDPDEDWYKYLIDRVTEGASFEDLHKNRIGFVTFNYDRSLEQCLFTTIRARYNKTPEEVGALLREFPIVHVYGALGWLPWQTPANAPCRNYDDSRTQGDIELAASSIKIMPDHVDSSNDFSTAQSLMSQADRIGILGFGYHPVNMRRLQLPLGKTKVYGTSVGMTEAEKRHVMTRYPGLGLESRGSRNLEFLRETPDFQND